MNQLEWHSILICTGILILLVSRTCTEPWRCDFETNDCGFTRDPGGSSTPGFSFIRQRGTTKSKNTGPKANDHHGYYIYMEASERKPNETVCNRSPDFDPLDNDKCLYFDYLVYGMHVGQLIVVSWTGSSATDTWTYQGTYKKNVNLTEWQKGAVNIPASTTNFGFKAVRGGSSKGEPYGDICIDDIVLDDKPCPGSSPIVESEGWPAANPMFGSLPSIYQRNYEAHPNCEIAKTLQFCTFDGNTELTQACAFYNAGSTMWSHQGAGLNDGPMVDSTTTSSEGKYLYIPSEDWRTAPALLVSPELGNVGGPFCLGFAYHMEGDHTGKLEVITHPADNSRRMVWSGYGNMGNMWRTSWVTLMEGTQRVLFEATMSRANPRSGWGGIALDDLKLYYSSCDVLEMCEDPVEIQKQTTNGDVSCTWDFADNSACMQNKNPNFRWERHRGPTPTENTGPSVDHTYGNTRGFYMYTETTGIPGGAVAVLTTPFFPGDGYFCVSFYYHMYGTDMGNLIVRAYTAQDTQFDMLISGTDRYTDEGWIYQRSTSPLNTMYLEFLGFKKDNTSPSQSRGDMAIDDLMVTRGVCEDDQPNNNWPSGSPSNEVNNWPPASPNNAWPPQNEPPNNAWPPQNEPPNNAWPPQNEPPNNAWPPQNEPPNNAWPPQNEPTNNAWPPKNEPPNNPWPPQNEPPNDAWPSQNEGNNMPPAEPEWPSSGANAKLQRDQVPDPPYPSCTSVLNLQQCGFNGPAELTSMCMFYNSRPSGKWLLYKGATSTESFLYVNPNQVASLSSPDLSGFGGPFCLSFDYTMPGQNAGRLYIQAQHASETPFTVWSRNDRQDSWKGEERTIMEGFQRILFVAESGSGGQIAIDNIRLMWGTCEGIQNCATQSSFHAPTSQPSNTLYSCDVELNKQQDSTYCSLQNTGSDFGWRRNKGSTPTMHTGPDKDHTYGTKEGHYYYFEVSGAPPDTVDRFLTPTFPSTGQELCLHFCYHMYGSDMGDLRVYAERYSVGETQVFHKTQNLNEWYCAELTLFQDTMHLIFEGTTKNGVTYGDMAVDDLRVTAGACDNPTHVAPVTQPSEPVAVIPTQAWKLNTGWEDCEVSDPKAICTFEDPTDDKCRFTSEGDFLWLLYQGSGVHPGAGHLHHNTLLKDNYWYINAKDHSPGQTAQLSSPSFNLMTDSEESERWAVSFRFHMEGNSYNNLSFYQSMSFESQDRLLWSRNTNKGDGLVTVNVQGNIHRFYFLAIIGEDNNMGGDIAIDNVTVQSWCLPVTQELKANPCPEAPCKEGHGCAQICTAKSMRPVCSCIGGYMLNNNGHTCSDVNECLAHPCPSPLRCVNSIGSYSCVGKCTRKK